MKNLEINLNAKVGKQRMFLLAVLDVLSVVAAYFLALMLRFDLSILTFWQTKATISRDS